jgi:replication factor C subunit 2/4
MIIPIRCMSCGKTLADKWRFYQDEVKKVLLNILKTGIFPNFIFYGPPGTGKTSAILALAYQLFGPKLISDRVLELNASDERRINVVRDKIIKFAKEYFSEFVVFVIYFVHLHQLNLH